MDEVLELATKLSRAIARSNRFRDLRTAEAAVMGSEEAVAAAKRREEVFLRLSQKEQKGEPIEPGDKREMQEADEAVKVNPLLSDLFRAQADFQEMLNEVNRLITSALEPEKKEPAEGEAGDAEA
jgi:cell fate (sporulation/competence/biofilm development) regulator YlbF (YheA/YmcA/DUF963 family)